MRIFAGRGAVLVIAGSLALAATPAASDDLLLMPYSCALIGGEPMLTRAGDEAHRIIGAREQQTFTTCSPADPSRCRQFTLHRFDLECGGMRVPWVAVAVAAARLRNARAWTANGRFHLQMPPRWGMAADDPCARGWDYGPRGWDYDDRGRFDRLARYCADRRMLAPPAVVEMPAGFAPMFGIGVFVAGTPGVSSPPSAANPPALVASGAPAKAQKTEVSRQTAEPRDMPLPAPAKKPPASKADHAQTAAAAPTIPSPATGPSTTGSPTAGSPTTGSIVPKIINRADPAASAPIPAPAPTTSLGETSQSPPTTGSIAAKVINRAEAAASGPTPASPPTGPVAEASLPPPTTGSIVPKIINRTDATPSGPAPASTTPLAEAPTAPIVPRIINRADPAPGGSTSSTPPVAEAPHTAPIAQAPASSAAPAKEVLPAGSPTPRGSPAAGEGRIAVGLIGMVGGSPITAAVAIGSLIMLVLAVFAFVRQREQARLSSVQPHDLASLSLEGGLPAVPVRPTRPWSGWGDSMPRSREEALRVLGVTADASETAIKKVVDGLRLSWHPDYAGNSDDLQIRELRTKQVNAAWDIIRGKREAA
jgi:hypothetical protein